LKLLLTALLLTVGVCAPASSARQEAAAVSVALGAVDKEGRAVEGLKPEDLRVEVEGAEQKVLTLSRRTSETLHVVIMLDASVSQEYILPQAQPAATHFALSLLRAGRDDAAVVSFSNGAKVVQKLTGDATAVALAIASVRFVRPPGYMGGGVLVYGKPPKNDPAAKVGTTALWDSLAAVCDELFAQAKGGRRAVVLVSDGVDTSSDTKRDGAVERLMRAGVAVYSVGIAEKFSFEPVDKSALRKLSERTGGRALFPKKADDLPVAFEQVRQELLTSYALTFAAPAPRRDGKPLKLHVELVNPELRRQGVQLAHPQSLFTESAAAPTGRS
jgi:VWFA-related protein